MLKNVLKPFLGPIAGKKTEISFEKNIFLSIFFQKKKNIFLFSESKISAHHDDDASTNIFSQKMSENCMEMRRLAALSIVTKKNDQKILKTKKVRALFILAKKKGQNQAKKNCEKTGHFRHPKIVDHQL